jgi:Protein kinase domain
MVNLDLYDPLRFIFYAFWMFYIFDPITESADFLNSMPYLWFWIDWLTFSELFFPSHGLFWWFPLTSHLFQVKELGAGAFGTVYQCRDAETSEPVAIKYIRIHDAVDGIPQWALREIALLRRCSSRHPNIIR